MEENIISPEHFKELIFNHMDKLKKVKFLNRPKDLIKTISNLKKIINTEEKIISTMDGNKIFEL